MRIIVLVLVGDLSISCNFYGSCNVLVDEYVVDLGAFQPFLVSN